MMPRSRAEEHAVWAGAASAGHLVAAVGLAYHDHAGQLSAGMALPGPPTPGAATTSIRIR